MAEVIRYLLLTNLFLLILGVFYKLVLERENWHRLNRFVLTGGVILALLIPLWQLDLVKTPDQALIVISDGYIWNAADKPDIILDEIQIYGEAPYVFPWMSMMKTLFIFGVLIMGLAFTLRIIRIKELQRENPMVWYRKLFVTRIPERMAPFSFLGVIYFPGKLEPGHETTELILKHESVHIRQRHSLDHLLIEVVKIFFFYNPVIYSIQHELNKTHEFLADAETAKTWDVETYSRVLLASFFNTPVFRPANAFHSSSLLKQRLIRLGQEYSGKWTSLKYMMLIPMWAVFLLMSALTLALP